MQETTKIMDVIEREVSFARILGTPVFWSVWLVAVNVAFFVIAFIVGLDRFETFPLDFTPIQYVFYSGMKVSEYVAQGQYWRLVTSMFVHLDFMHIGWLIPLYDRTERRRLGRDLWACRRTRRVWIQVPRRDPGEGFPLVHDRDGPVDHLEHRHWFLGRHPLR